MPGGAYYNEHDPVAAQWLRSLIAAGLIAPGEVDERDIRDVAPTELRGFVQCHFFAGIGIWSHAARRAGWDDATPLWSGSCPCQPFSDAGRKDGVADERHLWPHWQWLIAHERPPIVVGEQVASKDGRGWLDLVSADLEGSGYAFGAANLAAAGFGLDWRATAWREWLQRAVRHCPDPLVAGWLRHFAEWADQSLIVGGQHIRQRLYFVGLAHDPRRGCGVGGDEARARGGRHLDGGGDPSGGLVDRERERPQGHAGHDGPEGGREKPGRPATSASLSERLGNPDRRPAEGDSRASDRPQTKGTGEWDRDRGCPDAPAPSGSADRLDEPSGARLEGRAIEGPEGDSRNQARLRRPAGGRDLGRMGDRQRQRRDPELARDERGQAGAGGERGDEPDRHGGDHGASAPDGGGAPFDWVFCRDGCWRPVEPGASPLAHAVAARVGKLRAIGNGLDAETATAFMRVVGEMIKERYGDAA